MSFYTKQIFKLASKFEKLAESGENGEFSSWAKTSQIAKAVYRIVDSITSPLVKDNQLSSSNYNSYIAQLTSSPEIADLISEAPNAKLKINSYITFLMTKALVEVLTKQAATAIGKAYLAEDITKKSTPPLDQLTAKIQIFKSQYSIAFTFRDDIGEQYYFNLGARIIEDYMSRKPFGIGSL